MKNFGRNFIIAFLVVLAIYQTGELWFGDFSDHNFFSLLSQNESSYSKNAAYTLNRLIINLGDNRVICRGSNIYDSDYKVQFDKAVSVALTKGTLTENTGDVDWSNVLNNRAVIYEYSCSFKGSDLSGIFNVNSDNILKIKSYDTIIISPRADNSFMRVIFYDSAEKISSYAELKSNSIIGKCYETSSEFAGADDEIYYISSVENGFDIFSSNQFLPQSRTEIYSYGAIEPHFTMSDISMIEKNANIFFDNTVVKNYNKNDGNYVFSDEKTVVKFYDNSVFEYFNYDTKSSDENSFSANYAAAINIIKKDSFITNEFYLDSCSFSDGKYIFNFNYKINNLPLVPGEAVKNSAGMNNFIEITASNGIVDKYKKYACRYTISDRINLNAKVDFISAIDKIYAELYPNGSGTKPVDNITLAYIGENRNFGLKWIINIDGSDYIVSTEG
ncbi:MAG: hypothetical protein Q4D26_01405 [Clostridia bacterium]|nr:hypothetical protein [Clostridia bacterium]